MRSTLIGLLFTVIFMFCPQVRATIIVSEDFEYASLADLQTQGAWDLECFQAGFLMGNKFLNGQEPAPGACPISLTTQAHSGNKALRMEYRIGTNQFARGSNLTEFNFGPGGWEGWALQKQDIGNRDEIYERYYAYFAVLDPSVDGGNASFMDANDGSAGSKLHHYDFGGPI